MRERLLQFVWQHQRYNSQQLNTVHGERLEVLNHGTFNSNQGPDFLGGRIRIDGTVWAGNIELHVRSSDWNLHKHANDRNYDNIILHVVWEHDIEIYNSSGMILPTLELQNRVSGLLLLKYSEFSEARLFIPCESQVNTVDELTIVSWIQRLVVERLETRCCIILDLLHNTGNHWEEMFWIILARNFGQPVNAEGFEKMARSIPISILAKHKTQINQLEALVLGQAGLLDKDFKEKYPRMLQKEYAFYKNKYGLKKISQEVFFLRMRPSNFPTLRLAQLAMLIHTSSHLFTNLLEAGSLNEIRSLLNVTANDYWDYHYSFDAESNFMEKNIGAHMINSILINTVIPVLFAYGIHHNDQDYKDRAMAWLQQLAPESNAITNGFVKCGLKNNCAMDSQGYLQLKKEYCDQKRCLDCAIGCALLR